MTETALAIAFAFVLGACLGSFANVLVIRLHNMSSLLGRSRCPSCRKPLRPRHLVPILSWILLRGRCADCKAKIHFQYPVVEATAAALATIAAIRHDPFGPEWPLFAIETVIAVGLIVIVAMDMRWKELPLELMSILGLFGLIAIVGMTVPFSFDAVLRRLVSVATAVGIAVAFFGLQWVISRGKWLGSGDVWFGAMMGLVLGAWQLTVIAIYLAYVVGGFVVAVCMLFGTVKRGMRVPFAPALALGLLLAMWFGAAISARVSYVLSS
jgi:prepilin signal peptidase PulO-like enzyme (type II secretory pathway)